MQKSDILGKNTEKLKDKKFFLLDLDGTIYNENTLFDGTLEFINKVRANGGKCLFVTNNSSKGLGDYVKKLNRLGIKATKEDFFSSSMATSILLNEKFPGKKVYVQGTKSLIKELKQSGIRVTTKVEDDIDVILLGFDTELTSQKLRNTSYLLTTRNLPYYATNQDWVCPVSFGYIPDCGSISEMLKRATGIEPIFIGKPKPTMIELAMKKYNFSKGETVVIGDRVYTDIASGFNAGVDTICVLTGESTLESISKEERL